MTSSVELVESATRFTEVLDNAVSSGQLVVCHFAASWAEQCKQMGVVMEELSKDPLYKSVAFITIDAETLAEISYQYEIVAAPTFIFFQGKKPVDRLDGANASELTSKVQKLSASSGNSLEQRLSEEDLNSTLKKLINQAPVMLFMKGNPDHPRCGFSKQTIQILNEQNVRYSTFDILENDAVRQGLKKFSNWPTYPQLYVKGELLGGLDMIKELVESGELKVMLPQKEDLNKRLKTLISEAPIVLFMKGSPSTPRCGFSRTICGILNETGIPYSTFDILSDDEVRQGLKTFSNWPTFPQLYVKGELLGGLDIIKEMKESGELLEALKS